MEMGDGRSENMACVVEGQLDVRCYIGHTAVVERDGVSDIGLDFLR